MAQPSGRAALRYVMWQERRPVARELRALEGASPLAEEVLERVAPTGDPSDPTMSPNWRRDGERVPVFVAAPPAIRQVLATTNAIDSLHVS